MSDADANPSWLDEQQPHDEERSAAQITTLLQVLGAVGEGGPRRVLDLGCGAGRVLVPLAQAGHQVIGLDSNEESLAECRKRLDERGCPAPLLRADFLAEWPRLEGNFDAVCLLGNTIMTVADVDEAVRLMQRIRGKLSAGGLFIIDDCPHDFWPELADGNWTSGLTEDGTAQLLWREGDAVFTLRLGAEVDAEAWAFKASDRVYRLWTMGALRLAAKAAGLSGPQRVADGGLLIMRREAM